MPLLMIRNDITKMQVDAIVNPANAELRMGRGTSWAIYSAAGEEKLAAACQKLGGCEVGHAVLTKGFALPAKFIIHSACPPWTGGEGESRQLLKSAYLSALKLAAEYGFQSVAFPLLSTGFYGWPKAEAFHLATIVISEFLLEHEMTVYLVLYDHESVEVSKKLFSKIEEYIDDHYVDGKNEGYQYQKPQFKIDDVHSEMMIHDTATAYPSFSDEPRRRPSSPPSMAQAAPSCPSSPSMAQTAPFYPQCEMQAASTKSVSAKEKKTKKSLELPEFLKKISSPKGRKLDELMSHMDETFSQMLLRLIDERGLKDSTVYHKANIDRRLFSKIRNDVHYAPTKKTVLAFAIALELSLDETKDLLMKAGYAFSNSSKFDVIISFFIENRSYNVFEINEVLFAYGQPILGE